MVSGVTQSVCSIERSGASWRTRQSRRWPPLGGSARARTYSVLHTRVSVRTHLCLQQAKETESTCSFSDFPGAHLATH